MTAIRPPSSWSSINWTLITVRILENITELSLGRRGLLGAGWSPSSSWSSAGSAGAPPVPGRGGVEVTSILGG